MTTPPKPADATCQHRDWLETDEFFPNGPECGKPATHRVCDEIDKVVCSEHKCRCNLPLVKPDKPADEPSDASKRYIDWLNDASFDDDPRDEIGCAEIADHIERLESELARLRAENESAWTCIREQEALITSLRAESMRGAVEALRSYVAPGVTPYEEALAEEAQFQRCADWLEQQSATPQPECRAVQTARMRAERREK